MKLEPITIEEVLVLGDNLVLGEFIEYPDKVRWFYKISNGISYYKDSLNEEWVKSIYEDSGEFIEAWGIGYQFPLYLVLDEEGEPNET